MTLKPYLQLVRLPNVFTAAADSLAGWLLVTGTLRGPARWVPLAAASMAIYAAGMALNDLCDRAIDRVEWPNRPLPSGRVSIGFAAWLSAGLMGVGLILAWIAGGDRTLAVAVALVACVLAYDLGVKRSWFGPLVMGACRGLNVLLGLSVAQHYGGPAGWLAAGSMALFVVGVTWISRSEARGGDTAGPVAGWIVQNAALIGLMGAALQVFPFPAVEGATRSIIPLEGLLVLLIVAGVVNAATGSAVRDPTPARLQAAVKTGVLSLVWLNVGIVAAVRGPIQALAVAALWVPAFVLGKWLYST